MATHFQQVCYDLLKQIPAGKVTTYADIAHALGSKAYRAVGTAMNKNPNPVIVPCHRVVNSDGRLGNYAFGCERKRQLLESEGVCVVDGKVQHFEQIRFQFESGTSMIQHEGLRIFSILSQHNLIGALPSEAELSVSYKSMLDWKHKI